MKDMEELVELRIQAFEGDIKIPFGSLELLDEFTVRYQNREELINSLLAMLNLSIDKQRIREVYVHYEYIRSDRLREKNVVVKYSKDNFDKKTLIGFLKDFLKKDHDMIRYCGVRKIRSGGMYEFLKGYRDIADFEIDHAVEKYFDGAPYGIYRKVYFFLKNNGVKVNINRLTREENMTVERSLSKFHSDDDYVQPLLKLARDEENYDKVYEELSKIDLEDLEKILTNSHFGLFDGVNNDKLYTLEDLYDLQKCTSMDIDELCEVVDSSFRKGPRR